MKPSLIILFKLLFLFVLLGCNYSSNNQLQGKWELKYFEIQDTSKIEIEDIIALKLIVESLPLYYVFNNNTLTIVDSLDNEQDKAGFEFIRKENKISIYKASDTNTYQIEFKDKDSLKIIFDKISMNFVKTKN